MIAARRRGGIELVEEPGPTVLEHAAATGPAPAARKRLGRRRRPHAGARPLTDRFAFLRADSPVPIYIGIVVVLGGFGLIGVTWGKVAGLLQVPLQLPYLVSGGLTGLGLIMVGVTVISVSAKRRDAAERGRQLDRLAALMQDLHDAIRGAEEDR